MVGTSAANTCGDSYAAMLAAVQAFHVKHDFKTRGGEELVYRVALMSEELGEISAAITKGRAPEALAEECADLLILLLGTGISANLDLSGAFWQKMNRLMEREGRMVGGRIRVSETFESAPSTAAGRD
jgi:NTP pyrophosphatase (non-canonical NTP hydrolase)